MNGPYVAFETDRFRNDQPDDEIDQWHLGGDLAKWLHEGLVRQEHVTSRCDPLEEDWGWTFGIRVIDTRFWINIYNVRIWIVGLEAKLGLLAPFLKKRTAKAIALLKELVDALLATPEFGNVGWYDHWPDERC
jgi:hypothetical protein